MLVRLCISDFAIIKHLEIGFYPGLNILSGETGAGKSIIINAVNLLLGARASADLIRKGAEEARVEGMFQIPSTSPIRTILESLDLPFEGEVLIKRIVSKKGRNRITINGSIATLNMLSQLGPRLISISGQHANQILLSPENHLFLLDDFAGLGPQRDDLATQVRKFVNLKKDIDRLEEKISRAEQRRELARFQAEEIDRAAIRPGEDEELEEERKRIKFAQQLIDTAVEGYRVLYEDDEAVISKISRCLKNLENGADIEPRFREVIDNLGGAMAEIEEAAYALREYVENTQLDPSKLEEIEDRIYLLNQLKRKYGPRLEDVLAYRDEVTQAIEHMADDKALLERKRQALGQMSEELISKATHLSELRKKAASRLEAAVEQELKQLHMKGTAFKVYFAGPQQWSEQPERFSADLIREEGIDDVEFMISPNVGEPLKPLAKIASGGELSRIVLALKSILAQVDSVDTVVFDEVDSGISGATADVVGDKLLALSKRHQVLCITHLPQIAAKGRAHFLVKKHVKEGRTQTSILELDQQGRVMEIARLLGGKKITQRAISRAEEMIG